MLQIDTQTASIVGCPFTFDIPRKEIHLDQIGDLVLKHPGHYEGLIKPWVENKLLPRLYDGLNYALLMHSEKKLIGECVWQDLNDNSDYDVEIKNFRIIDEFKDRRLATFLMNQIDFRHHDKRIVLDVTKANTLAYHFYLAYGFVPIEEKELYKKGQLEVIMALDSNYTKTEDGIIIPKKVILN